MRSVGARELKNRTGEILHWVAEGEAVYVTRRGRTIARIEPVSAAAADLPPEIKRLLRRLRGKHRDLPRSDAYALEKRREARREQG